MQATVRWARAVSGVKGVKKNREGWRRYEDRRGLKNAMVSSQLSLQGFLRAWSAKERKETAG